MYPLPLVYKRGRPLEENSRQVEAEDRLIHNQEQYYSQWM